MRNLRRIMKLSWKNHNHSPGRKGRDNVAYPCTITMQQLKRLLLISRLRSGGSCNPAADNTPWLFKSQQKDQARGVSQGEAKSRCPTMIMRFASSQ